MYLHEGPLDELTLSRAVYPTEVGPDRHDRTNAARNPRRSQKLDAPRIALPDSKELLLASAAVGGEIAAQLDAETLFDIGAPLVGVLAGRGQGPPLENIAVPTRIDGKALDPTKDLALTAG
jgi:hypothetical protein